MKRAILAALLAVTMAAGAQAADKVTTVPVQFAKGPTAPSSRQLYRL